MNPPTAPRIVLCGIQQQGIEIAAHLLANGIRVSHMVTISENNAAKNKAAGWVSYEDFAKLNNITLYHAKSYSLNQAEDQAFFDTNQFDLLIFGGWQRLLPAGIIATVKHGCIGQHGSSEFLPRGRGRSPLNWSLITGRKRLVWNLFLITPGVDDGDIIDFMIFDINEWDTCNTLYQKVAVSVKKMLTRSIPSILNGSITTMKQVGEPTYYEKRTAEDGNIDWNSSVFGIYNLIRAVTHPYPGAFTFSGQEKVMIWKAQPWDTHLSYSGAEIGEVVEAFSENEFVVNCCDGLLLVTESTVKNLRPGLKFTSKLLKN